MWPAGGRRGALSLALVLAACHPTTRVAATEQPALRQHGEPLPILSSGGEMADLRDLSSPVTVVVLWASFCVPCVEHLPELEVLYERSLADPNLGLFVVSVDPPESRDRARALLAERAPTLPGYSDVEASVARWLMPRTKAGRTMHVLPLFAIIDADGEIHRRVDVEADRSGVSLSEVIEGALAGAMPAAMADVFAQGNPPLPPPGSTVKTTLMPDPSDEAIAEFLAWVETIHRQNPELSDDAIARTIEEIRARIEAGETRFELHIPGMTE